MAGFMADTLNTKTLVIEPGMLDIIAELDEFVALLEHPDQKD